ncbi:MAG: hypothetical protein O3A47_09095, partial [Chloroflexi bacterium]|nr:hypothetical protein [Chloroflexota bacterium]
MKTAIRLLVGSSAAMMLLLAFGVIPAIGAVAGSVTLDKPFITTPGGTLKVTLNDKDLDVALNISDGPNLASTVNDVNQDAVPERAFAGTDEDLNNIVDDYQYVIDTNGQFRSKANVALGVALGPDNFLTVRVSSFPILDSNGDGIVNSADVTVTNADGTTVSTHAKVYTLANFEGLVTLQALVAPTAAQTNVDLNGNAGLGDAGDGRSFKLVYKAAKITNENVKVISSADTIGFSLAVRETAAATGVYEATFKTGSGTDPNSAFTEDFQTGIVDTNLDGRVDATDKVDINGDGDTTDTSLLGGLHESFYGADLNGDADQTDVLTTGTYNEVTLTIDLDGDGATTSTAVAARLFEAKYNRDLNGDGDKTDALTAFPASLFPQWANRPTISTVSGSIITISYSDGDPAGTRTGSATVETTKPVVVVTSPLHKSATQNTQ